MQVPHTVYNWLRWKTALSRVWRPSSDSSLSFMVNTVSEGKSKEPDQTADAHTALSKISICKDTQEWHGVWSDGGVSCILRHRGIQLILAYSWAKPAILVAGNGRGGWGGWNVFMYSLSSLLFLFLFLPSSSFISSTISFLPFSGRWDKMTNKGWRVVKPQHNQKSRNDQSQNTVLAVHEIRIRLHETATQNGTFKNRKKNNKRTVDKQRGLTTEIPWNSHQ